MSDTLGSRLRKIRDHLRLSQEKFAESLGVSQFTLSNYENGKRFPDSRFFEKLKEVANVNLNWLIGGEVTIEDFCPDIPDDKEMKDFFYWFNKLPIVRHTALTSLEDLKFKYPDLFKEEKAAPDK